MSSPTASSIVDQNFSNEDIILVLVKCTNGYRPENVLADVNPFDYEPKHLPCGFWYLITSKQNEATNSGSWRVKGEACMLFSNSVITGWRTTLAFFEGQTPFEDETDWLMHKYWITQNVPGEDSKFKVAKSLCRVFRGGYPHHEKDRKMTCETHNHGTQSSAFTGVDATNNGSASNIKVDQDVEIRTLALTGRTLDNIVERALENDEVPEGDFLELNDLQIRMSPSSSSDSSVLSMSSDECFDYVTLLKDIESDSNREMKPNQEDCKLSVFASQRADELVMFPASPESFVVEESHPAIANFRQTDLPSSALPKKHTHSGGDVEQHTPSNQNVNLTDEGPSHRPEETGSSSSSNHSGSKDGKGKDNGKGRKKRSKNKYLCFMPFHFFI